MPSTPDATTTSPAVTSARFDTSSMPSGGSPSTPTAIPPARVRSLTAPAAALRSMMSCTRERVRGHRADDAPDHALRRDHRHVGLDAVGRAAIDR